MQRIYNILVSILGESKQGYFDKSVSQYQFNCPTCADEKGEIDNKYNLEISFSLGKYHCWSCGDAGPISKLVKKRGGKELYDDYVNVIKDLKENSYYNLEMFNDTQDFFSYEYLKLPLTFRKIDFEHCNKELKEYLSKRRITQDIIDYYNIGVTTWNEEDYYWRNRIIIPSYDASGDLNYFIGRTYKENDKRSKYKNCDIDKTKIILHEDKIQWDADIYLVEGAIDCIYYPNSISLMGKSLKNNMVLYDKLMDRANGNIVICLDGDTDIEETKRIYKLLNKDRLRGKIKYIRLGENLPWKDFGEVYEDKGKGGLIYVMKQAKEFSEIELL